MSSVRPTTLAQLSDALASGCAEVATFFRTLTPDELATRQPGEWAPIDDLDHLRLSLEPVIRALATPAEALSSRYGSATRPSVTYDVLQARYQARLAEGVHAPPPFVPTPEPEEEEPSARRDDLLARWAELGNRLQDALGPWTEDELDRCQLPHPALGTLTMREMLFFTDLHNRHHIEVARRRLERGTI